MMYVVATLTDGTKFTVDRDGTWDALSRDARIVKLAVHCDAGVERLAIERFDRYVFGNEAVSVNGGKPVLEAKIIGGVQAGHDVVQCWRVDLVKETAREYAQSIADFAPHVFRQGV